MMRKFLPAAALLGMAFGCMVAGSNAARAGANLAYCLQRGETVECYYTTYEQCAASASGTGADCIANPDPKARQPEPAGPARRSPRRR
jgi:Protein of unknown function (DUF3551)